MQRAARLAAHFIGALLCFSAFGQEEVSTPQFTLTLPEWDSDPEDLPPELRPWSIERPTLPEDAAAVVAELEARITGIQDAWPEAETREAQDAFLNEAIGLAERVLALREEYQGNGEKILRWRNAAGEPTAWFEVTDARARLDQLKALLGASPKERRQFREAMAFITARTRSATGQSPAEVAEQLRDALEVTKSMLGGGHPGVVLANARTGYVLQAIGHLAGAEQNYRSAVNAALQSLGSDHPDFLFSASSFGYFLTVTGRPAEGEVYYKQALLGYRRIYGDSHTRTIAAINNVGYALHEQGRFDEVALFARAALIGFEATQGSDHVDTLTAANNLGYLLATQGRLADAEGYLQFANRGFRTLAPEHPLMSSVLGNMGYLRDKQGRAHEAEEYWLLAIETSRNESGRIDPSAQQWVNNLGTLLASQGRDVKAESYYRSAIADFRSSMDPRHPYILRSKANLGALLAKRGDLGQARPYLVDALDGFREQLGDDHPFTLSAIHMLGLLSYESGELDEAEKYYSQALRARRQLLGDHHPDTLDTLIAMGVLCAALEDHRRANESLETALTIAEQLRTTVGANAEDRASFAAQIGTPEFVPIYARSILALGDHARALGVLERARARSALDLLGQGPSLVTEALEQAKPTEGVTRYESALVAERSALVALRDAEGRLAATTRSK